jgi:hypothetical protein
MSAAPVPSAWAPVVEAVVEARAAQDPDFQEASPVSVDLHLPPLVLSQVVDAADLRTR